MIFIGVDFDNTIVSYDKVFYQIALEQNLIPDNSNLVSKEQIRNFLRETGKEKLWTLLQGKVYGTCMEMASPFPQVIDFFNFCKDKSIGTVIISHKTRFPFAGPKYDLHDAAQKWLESYKLDSLTQNIFFEPTKQDKLCRIKRTGCTDFIDDLPEFLSEPNFPQFVERHHFDPNYSPYEHPFHRLYSWDEAISWIKNR